MEKYGEIPKRFTKAWWEYFWDYYKWHTLGTLFAILLIAITCVQCATRVKYDIYVTYVGNMMFVDETIQKLRDELSQHIEDIDGNGQALLNFQALSLAADGTQQAGTEYDSSIRAKFMMELQTGDSYIYLMTKQELDRLLDRQDKEKIFIPVSDWSNIDISGFDTAKVDSVDYAVNITDNKFFAEKMGLTMGDSLYLGVRRMRTRDTDNEIQKKMFEQSKKLASWLLENN